MITNLHIKNIGIIDDLEINLNKGMNVLTGETGAGKTLIIDSLGIICGGAYHNHCSYFGLIGRHDNIEALDEVHKYLNVQKLVSFGLQGIGFLLLAMFIVLKWTVFPRWMMVVSPGILFLISPFTRKLPKGLHMIISGGWTNLISVIYYGVAIIILNF